MPQAMGPVPERLAPIAQVAGFDHAIEPTIDLSVNHSVNLSVEGGCGRGCGKGWSDGCGSGPLPGRLGEVRPGASGPTSGGSGRRQHLPQVAEQSEAGDIRAGVAAKGAQQFHQRRLAPLHRFEGRIDPARLGHAGRGGGEQHPAAEGPAEQKRIARPQGALAPVALRRGEAIHRERQAEARPIATLQGMATNQACPERIEHRAHPRQGLQQQFLLQRWRRLRQGHQGLHARHRRATGPEIAAGMQGGEACVEPGVGHQGRKAINALEQQGAIRNGRHHGGVLGRGRR